MTTQQLAKDIYANAKIKGLDDYNSNAWRKNLSNWRNQNLVSRLKRVVKGKTKRDRLNDIFLHLKQM